MRRSHEQLLLSTLRRTNVSSPLSPSPLSTTLSRNRTISLRIRQTRIARRLSDTGQKTHYAYLLGSSKCNAIDVTHYLLTFLCFGSRNSTCGEQATRKKKERYFTIHVADQKSKRDTFAERQRKYVLCERLIERTKTNERTRLSRSRGRDSALHAYTRVHHAISVRSLRRFASRREVSDQTFCLVRCEKVLSAPLRSSLFFLSFFSLSLSLSPLSSLSLFCLTRSIEIASTETIIRTVFRKREKNRN